MKTALKLACLLFVATAFARDGGTIHGKAIDANGQPIPHLSLRAAPLGVVLGTAVPETITNEKGEYRFERLQGRYTVLAEDEAAGYTTCSKTGGITHPAEVELTSDRWEAELQLKLPPKAAFLKVNLTNRRTGAPIPTVDVSVMDGTAPSSLICGTNRSTSHAFVLPPDRDILVHITSPGFREWDLTVGAGKPIHAASGAEVVLNVQLEPSNE
jgi:hypothetical protein